MRKDRNSTSFNVKASVIPAKMSERGENLQRFADRLIANLHPKSHLGCTYNVDTNQLICFKK